MRCDDARRLTGRSHWAPGPAAAVVVVLDPSEASEEARAVWRGRVEADMVALGWPKPQFHHRVAGSMEVWTASAPIDRLHAAVALCEAAVESDDGEARRAAAMAEVDAAGDPALLALEALAARTGSSLLWDDDAVSLGWGTTSVTWPRDRLPAVGALRLAAFRRIPTALITGTNGKTTTTRLLARMIQESGQHVGTTSTDGLTLDGALIESGDWTGPGGARALLRDRRVEVAVLEAARGGMLRRGLAVDGVDVAAVTNVSADHLGEWGIDTVAAMAEVKLLVADAVRPGGRLVVGDDQLVPGDARSVAGPLIAALERRGVPTGVEVFRFAARAPSTEATVGVSSQGRLGGWLSDDGELVIDDGVGPALRIPVSDVPITVGGMALHNVENALCAALLARGLGLPDAAILAGLRGFRPDPTDSPGRGNLLRLGGARVLLDFGHNPDGVRRVAQMASRVGARRRLVVLGQAGDRSDADIVALIDALAACSPARWLLKSMPHYDRGRAEGEVVAVLQAALAARGEDAVRISVHPSEDAATRAAIAELESGDLLILLVHEDAPQALARLTEAGATVGW